VTEEPGTAGKDPDTGGEEQATEEWWQVEGMPWKHKPGRADIACMVWIGIYSIYGLAMLPLRGWLFGSATDVLAMITGGRVSVTASGALAGVGRLPYWPVVLLVAAVASIKLDWIYWWAGKLWGHGMIEVWAGRSKRAARNYARAVRWAEKLGAWGFVIAYLPIPLPIMPVVFVLSGATGLSLKRFLLYDFFAGGLWLALYFWFGWQIGEPAVGLLDAYARISSYVAIGLLAVVLGSVILKPGKAVKKQ
jgi:hypothetical protein